MLSEADTRMSQVLQDLRPENADHNPKSTRQSIAERLRRWSTPGLSVAVISDFKLDWANSFGTRISGQDLGVKTTTLFQAASMSKPVFALAVMRLAESGRLDLDVDVNQYLSSWQVPSNNGWRPHITLRQLLSHTAGTTVHGFPGYPAAGSLPTLQQILCGSPPANNLPIRVDQLPGFAFRYSGGGTTIAQQAIMDVLNKPFPTIMRELVFEPLNMVDSTFEQPIGAKLSDRAARAHPWNNSQTPGGWHVYPEMAAAGLWTTASDMARLSAEVMRVLRGDDSCLGIKQQTIAEMLLPQLSYQKLGQDFYGLGWFCSGKDNNFKIEHKGTNEGFVAEIRLFPSVGLGAVVMINSNQGWPICDELFDAIGREYRYPVSEVFPNAVSTPTRIDYSGLYRSGDGMTFRILRSPTGFQLQSDHQMPVPLSAAAGDLFYTTALNLRLKFDISDAGEPISIAISDGGHTLNLSRSEE